MSFSIHGLTHRYRRAKSNTFTSLDLHIPGGVPVALLGPSGTGKTTLLNLLGLLLGVRYQRGQVVYHATEDTIDYHSVGRRRRLQLRLNEFGYVLQSCYLLPNFSCAANIGLPLALRGESRQQWVPKVDRLMAAAGDTTLAEQRDKPGSEVSVGQRQRMAVLRGIIHDPRVVFADEPTSNLDPGNTRAIVRLLGRWQRGELVDSSAGSRSLVVVCHHLETARSVAGSKGHFVVLKSGQVPLSFPACDWDQHAADVEQRLDSGVQS